MPFEIPLMQELGFEVFVPKVIPKQGFRSGLVDYSFDSSLSIPPAALRRLNDFNFYEEEWPTEITVLANRYFGAAFMMPHARQIEQVVDHFEGQVVLRAFGLDHTQTYKKVLENQYGSMLWRKLKYMGDRFWFGEAYDNLHECEELWFANRSLFLPIGLPAGFIDNPGGWTGLEKTILFACPNASSNPYYSAMYRDFKENFGDLPHLIIGVQDAAMDDPSVLGFITDQELNGLYVNCSLLYYPSREPRHVHYTPVEAAIAGMPIVFFEGSLLDRLSNVTYGKVASTAEARSLVERILDDDARLIDQIRDDQRDIAFHFSADYCRPMWERQMNERGFRHALRASKRSSTVLREMSRSTLKPVAKGRLRSKPHKKALLPPTASLSCEEARARLGSCLEDGIDFRNDEYPAFVDFVVGLSAAEDWGRWSIGDEISVVLRHQLTGQFRLFVRATGYGENAGDTSRVRIGPQVRVLRIPYPHEDSFGSWIDFDLKKPENVIRFSVPRPTRPGTDERQIGLGLIELKSAPVVTRTEVEALNDFGSSLAQSIDFTQSAYPPVVSGVQGLGQREDWGRWSCDSEVVLQLNHTLDGNCRLVFVAGAYGENAELPFLVSIGDQSQSVSFPPSIRDEVAVDFRLSKPGSTITIRVPKPTRPPGEDRLVGLAMHSVRSEHFDD
jgi:hypothetical protein